MKAKFELKAKSPEQRAYARYQRALDRIGNNKCSIARFKHEERIKKLYGKIYYDEGHAYRLLKDEWIRDPTQDSKYVRAHR